MIIKTNDLQLIREKHSTKKIVLLKGSFDLLHTGHIYMMEQAKKNGDILVVIVKPNVLVHPKGHKNPNELEKLYEELNTKIIEIERDESKISTTKIINKIRNYK